MELKGHHTPSRSVSQNVVQKEKKVSIKKASQRINLPQKKREKLLRRRPTRTVDKHILKRFLELYKWWQKPSIVYAFSIPFVRARMEKLMGSNRVSLTDRDYMIRLQERILEDYAEQMGKRIKVREAQEMERVKNLVLTGKIPIDDAPPEMANHPVILIEMYCRKLIAERRAKIKVPKVKIPTYLFADDTPDPPSGLSIEKGHVFRKGTERLCTPPEIYLVKTDQEDIEAGYMFTDEDYDLLKYEDELIKELRACETVEEMYELADEILGALVNYDEVMTIGDQSRMTEFSVGATSTATNATTATATTAATT